MVIRCLISFRLGNVKPAGSWSTRLILVATLFGSLTPIMVHGADDTEVNLTQKLPGRPNVVATKADNEALSETSLCGTIVDDEGQPVIDVTLSLCDRTERVIESAKPDAEGKYAFGTVNEGPYYLAIKASRYKTTSRPNFDLFQLGPDKTFIHDFKLARLCTMKVHVIDDESGEPVDRVPVFAMLMGTSNRQVPGNSITDKDGWTDVSCTKKASGKYLIFAVQHGYAWAHITQALDNPKRLPRRTIYLTKGKTIKGKIICSDRFEFGRWRISTAPTWLPSGFSVSANSIDENGAFELNHVASGKYDVKVSMPHGDDKFGPSMPVLCEANLLQIGEPLEVRAPSSDELGMVAGKIEIDGNFPERQLVQIEAHFEGGPVTGTTDFIGGHHEFRIFAIPKGLCDLQFSHPLLEPYILKDLQAPRHDLVVKLRIKGSEPRR